SVPRQRLVGPSEIRIAEDRTHGGCVAAGQIKIPGRAEVLEAVLVRSDLVVERLVDLEPTARDSDGRSEGWGERARSMLGEGRRPQPRSRGHSDAQATGHALGEGDR